MNLADTLKLIEAGFTADEIRNMETADTAGSEPEPAAPVQTDPEPKNPEPAADPEPAGTAGDLKAMFKALTEEAAALRQLVQATNARTMDVGSGAEHDTVEDILASIINPKTKEEIK